MQGLFFFFWGGGGGWHLFDMVKGRLVCIITFDDLYQFVL